MAPQSPTAPQGDFYYPTNLERLPVLYPQPAIGPPKPKQHHHNHTMQPPPLPYEQMLQMKYYNPQVTNPQFASNPQQIQYNQQGGNHAPQYQPYPAYGPFTSYSAPAPQQSYRANYSNTGNNPAARARHQTYRQLTLSQQLPAQPFIQKEVAPSSFHPSNGSENMDISEVATSSPHPSNGSEDMDISDDEGELDEKKETNPLPAHRFKSSRSRVEAEMTMLLASSSHAPAQVEKPALDPYSTEAEDLPAPFHSPPALETSHGHWAAVKLDKSLSKGDNNILPTLHTTYAIPAPQLAAARTSTTTPSEAEASSEVAASKKNEGPTREAKYCIVRKATDFGSWSSPEDTSPQKKNF